MISLHATAAQIALALPKPHAVSPSVMAVMCIVTDKVFMLSFHLEGKAGNQSESASRPRRDAERHLSLYLRGLAYQ